MKGEGVKKLGQKVNPRGFRLGMTEEWRSRWYEEKDYSHHLLEDYRIRQFLEKTFSRAGVSKIIIDRAVNKIRINVFAGRPGIAIGKKGDTIGRAKKDLEKLIGNANIFLNVQEVSQPDLDAKLLADKVAFQLQKKTGTKRVVREAIKRVMAAGAGGVRIACKGRIAGAEIARKEWMKEGRIPLHTLRARIDYAHATSHTSYGCIGIKVWIFTGEVLPSLPEEKLDNETSAKKSKIQKNSKG